MISLSETFKEDAQEVKDALLLLSSTGKRDAQIVSTGRRMRDEGMARAAEGAEHDCPGWGDMAFNAVKEFVKVHTGRFQAEDVRQWATHVPVAPNLRAWGSVISRSVREKVIKSTGETEKVKNPLAHCANAQVWIAA